MFTQSRFFVLAATLLVATVVHKWVDAQIGSQALAVVGAAFAVLPIILLFRCQIDPCLR